MPSAGLRGRQPRLPEDQRYPLDWAHNYLLSAESPAFPLDTSGGVEDLGMDGNDLWGNCGAAGEVHIEMTTAGQAGTTGPAPNSPLAVQRYVQFAPAPTPPGPPGPGLNLPVYLHQLWLAGIIKAWAPADATNLNSLFQLMQQGFAIYSGVNLFDANEDQFNSGQPFDVVAGQAPDPEDGHCVVLGKAASATGLFDVGTWGVWWQATYAWLLACLVNNPGGEAYVIATTEEQAAKFDPQLLADINALPGSQGAQPTPDPAPTSLVQRIEEIFDDALAAIRSLF